LDGIEREGSLGSCKKVLTEERIKMVIELILISGPGRKIQQEL